MNIDAKVIDSVKKVSDGFVLNREEISYLLSVSPHSVESGYIMASADTINRLASNGKAEVHAQIGVNLAPCPKNCSFCAFAAQNKVFTHKTELTVEEIIQLATKAERKGANALFFMVTGDYPLSKFIEISQEVREKINPQTVMIANIGDFDSQDGKHLKDAGYLGIYHAVRMGEGKDTKIDPNTRLRTIKAAQEAGLLIGTCVEPVGPEHTIQEITEKILIGRNLQPSFSGAMRRITIPNSPLEKYGMISEYRMAFLVAVVRLAMGREIIGNCTHEPNILGATSGANLFWAEAGSNPRDIQDDTSKGRGLDVQSCINMFKEADFEMLTGPTVIYSNTSKRFTMI